MPFKEILSLSTDNNTAKPHAGVSHNVKLERASQALIQAWSMYKSVFIVQKHTELIRMGCWLIFSPCVFAGWLHHLGPLNPVLFMSNRSKRSSASLVILTKYPQLGLIGPDWCGLGHVPISAPITVIRERRYYECLA